MRKFGLALLLFAGVFFFGSYAQAHFGLLVPSKATVLDKKGAKLQLTIAFAHPTEQHGMDMAKPKAFFVKQGAEQQDLLASIKPAKLFGHQSWSAEYTVAKPGVYAFALEPMPYFEPAEDCYIVHYTKVLVPAFGEEENWVN